MTLNRLEVKAQRVLAFDNVEVLIPLGVDPEAFRRGDYARTREIGSAAHFLDVEGLLVPSERRAGSNLVLFRNKLDDLDALSVMEKEDLNWPAWRERITT